MFSQLYFSKFLSQNIKSGYIVKVVSGTFAAFGCYYLNWPYIEVWKYRINFNKNAETLVDKLAHMLSSFFTKNKFYPPKRDNTQWRHAGRLRIPFHIVNQIPIEEKCVVFMFIKRCLLPILVLQLYNFKKILLYTRHLCT